MEQAKVSIIIPVYKVEAYVERCVRSLFEQTLVEIEFIFVDDCSPDKGIEVVKSILDLYPQRVSQVKIIRNEQNRGVSFTRNVGLQEATGAYIIHVDSDDWVESTMMADLYNCAVKGDYDLVWSDFFVDYPTKNESRYYSQQFHENASEIIKAILTSKLHGGLWNKLIKHDLIQTNNIYFPSDVNMCEDQTFVILCLLKSKSIKYLSVAHYHYIQHSSSLTVLRNKASFVSEIRGINILEKQLPQHDFDGALLNYKGNLKSSIFLSGLFSNNEFQHIFPESESYMVANTNGRFKKLGVWFAQKNYFYVARFIIYLSRLKSILK